MTLQTKKSPRKKTSPTGSLVETRKVNEGTRCRLWGLAGARCEFPGCNRLLLEHGVTSLQVNIAEVAHVVGFREDGPRGRGNRPDDIHAIENLMLMSPDCHKLIDDNPGDFSRELLLGYKREHEARIRHLTGLSPEMGTTVVQLKGLIAAHLTDIPVSHVYEAVSPRWPTDRQGFVIDLGAFDVDSAIGAQQAAAHIDTAVLNLYRPGMDAQKTRHISLFALAPIPVLMHLGSRLSNKSPIDFFQRHRDMKGTPWKWRNDGPPVGFVVRKLQTGAIRNKVALVLSLSGPVPRESLPSTIDAQFTIYEMSLDGVTPHVDFLRGVDTLEAFRGEYRRLLAELSRVHGQYDELHVFPAVPSPVAVALGHDLLSKVHPDLLAYDNDRLRGGFQMRLRVSRKLV